MSELLTPPRVERDPARYVASRSATAGVAEGEVSLASLIDVVLRHTRLIGGVAVVLAGLVVGIGLVRARTWSSEASLILTSRQGGSASGLSGLAASLGVNVMAGEATQSPAFYADLIRSREILGAVVDSGIVAPDGKRVPLVELYEAAGDTPELRRANAIYALSQSLDVSLSTKTGVVRLVVTAPSAWAAKQLADRILGEVARFNLETRQSQAAAERRFTERRLAAARAELSLSEGRLRDFLQGNRSYTSPSLDFERERLQREVYQRQELVATLTQSYERARIDEVRDTPVFTVVEQPELPPRPDPRGLLKKGILTLIAGGILGMVAAFVLEFVRGVRAARAARHDDSLFGSAVP